MELYEIGEIIWAKIRGYPWWPAIITKLVEENKETKYVVGFIGDNTHSVLPKNKIAKFLQEMKNYSKTRKKKLINSINIAKSLMEEKLKSTNNEERPFEKKTETVTLNTYSIPKPRNLLKKKRLLKRKEKSKQEKIVEGLSFVYIDESSSSTEKEIKIKKSISKKVSTSSTTFDYKKRRRRADSTKNEETQEITDMMKNIISYLFHISKILDKMNWQKEKEGLMKILTFLQAFKMDNPINYLKRTNLGILIKFMNNNIQDSEIKEMTNKVYKNLEDQVLSQLFDSKK